MTAVRKKILCIEDDIETARLIGEDLTERGFEVLLVHEAEQAIPAILASCPDLVLCDVSMPGLSGFEVLEQLTAITPRCENMPFVFLTALADRDNELRGRRLGADDYVTKPIDFDVLETIITARLARVARSQYWPQDVGLTAREAEALTWSARGKTSEEIAPILGLTKRTVDFHLDNARRKLGVATRVEAAAKAVSARLIEP